MSADFSSLLAQAKAAGMAAGMAAAPVPMIVSGGVPGQPQQSWFVSEGVCGFAWVKVAGNTSFGRWAKAHGFSKWSRGLAFWVGEFGQSMARKEAFARAFAQVLNAAGIEAFAESRMD